VITLLENYYTLFTSFLYATFFYVNQFGDWHSFCCCWLFFSVVGLSVLLRWRICHVDLIRITLIFPSGLLLARLHEWLVLVAVEATSLHVLHESFHFVPGSGVLRWIQVQRQNFPPLIIQLVPAEQPSMWLPYHRHVVVVLGRLSQPFMLDGTIDPLRWFYVWATDQVLVRLRRGR